MSSNKRSVVVVVSQVSNFPYFCLLLIFRIIMVKKTTKKSVYRRIEGIPYILRKLVRIVQECSMNSSRLGSKFILVLKYGCGSMELGLGKF